MSKFICDHHSKIKVLVTNMQKDAERTAAGYKNEDDVSNLKHIIADLVALIEDKAYDIYLEVDEAYELGNRMERGLKARKEMMEEHNLEQEYQSNKAKQYVR